MCIRRPAWHRGSPFNAKAAQLYRRRSDIVGHDNRNKAALPFVRFSKPDRHSPSEPDVHLERNERPAMVGSSHPAPPLRRPGFALWVHLADFRSSVICSGLSQSRDCGYFSTRQHGPAPETIDYRPVSFGYPPRRPVVGMFGSATGMLRSLFNLRKPTRLAIACGYLFGKSRNLNLVGSRLEASRRSAILTRNNGSYNGPIAIGLCHNILRNSVVNSLFKCSGDLIRQIELALY